MGWFEYSFIFIISWWLALFMVLPIGAKLPESAEGSAYPAAPTHFPFKKKLIYTTLLGLFFTLMVSWGMQEGFFTLWTKPL